LDRRHDVRDERAALGAHQKAATREGAPP
jgi:hypothetical protein